MLKLKKEEFSVNTNSQKWLMTKCFLAGNDALKTNTASK